jgi:hypothetical protein
VEGSFVGIRHAEGEAVRQTEFNTLLSDYPTIFFVLGRIGGYKGNTKELYTLLSAGQAI